MGALFPFLRGLVLDTMAVSNPVLSSGVTKYSRTAQFRRRRLYKGKRTSKVEAKVDAPTTKSKAVGGDKNGKKRTMAVAKTSRFYPTEDIRRKQANRKNNNVPNMTRLRASIVPGSVVILVSGPHKGKRVVVLKQLPTGLLLVSGPYKINGVPLRRVNQRYVIATKTVVDVSKVDVSSVDDAFFAKVKADKKAKSEADFMEGDAAKATISKERIDAQKRVDAGILAAVKAGDGYLAKYLAAPFRLTSGQFPHEMTF